MRIRTLQLQNVRSFEDSGLIEFGAITLFVGRNNSGKSTLLRALSSLQVGTEFNLGSARRMGRDESIMHADFTSEPTDSWGSYPLGGVDFQVHVQAGNSGPVAFLLLPGSNMALEGLPNYEPANLIYPYFSNRRSTGFGEDVTSGASLLVRNDLHNLSAKVDRLNDPTNPHFEEFTNLVRDVIGLRITSISSSNGKQVGVWTNGIEWVSIEEMGDGVAQMLGLIVQLCVAERKIFLIEELENDIHPEALKALLRVIESRASNNQFVISTHNNIVLRHLGSHPDARIYQVASEVVDDGVHLLQTSSVQAVGNSVLERTALLGQLGYELSDMDLHDGWIIFEESSAERIVREYLVPWFAPRLRTVKTVAARGTGDLYRTFEALDKLVLFTHLQTRYAGRVLVVADGEPGGVAAIEDLKSKYPSWLPDSFTVFSQPDFERYYPALFAEQAAEVLALADKKQKRESKQALLEEVLAWCETSPTDAKAAFESSAADVIQLLREFESRF